MRKVFRFGVVVLMVAGTAFAMGPLARRGGHINGPVGEGMDLFPSVERVAFEGVTSMPSYVHGDLGTLPRGDRGTAAAVFMDRVRPAFGLDSEDELRPQRVVSDALGMTHIRLFQFHDGLPVDGGDIALHVGRDGVVRTINGHLGARIEAPPIPGIDGRQAVSEFERRMESVSVSVLKAPRLVYYTRAGEAAFLAWRAEVEWSDGEGVYRERVYVDANDGTVLDRQSLIWSAKYRKISNYNNAYWNGSQMVFGDGDGSTFSPLSGALDVVAHELTHAVTENTANLNYSYESGALNEAMSDILGAATEEWIDGSISSNTWKIGEDIYTPGTSGDALRYMNNPTADGQSYDYYPERYTGSQDNGGVHLNSGIANLAFYLLSQGGTHPRGKTSVSVPAQGIVKARAVFYRALSVYMTSSTNFEGARNASAQAAQDLYGSGAYDSMHKAWDAVGVPGTPVTVTPLTNGQTVSGLSGGTGSWAYYNQQLLRLPPVSQRQQRDRHGLQPGRRRLVHRAPRLQLLLGVEPQGHLHRWWWRWWRRRNDTAERRRQNEPVRRQELGSVLQDRGAYRPDQPRDQDLGRIRRL